MRKHFYLIAAMLCTAAIVSCTGNKKNGSAEASSTDTTQVADMHTAETSLDYFGEYKGTIPAADCPGIKVTLVLNKNKTYAMNYLYIDRKDAGFDETGTFKIEGNIITLSPKDGAEAYYKVEEGRISMLMANKQPITGELKDMYVLKQEKVF